MKLTDIENKLDIHLPNKIHTIYKSGAMEWLLYDDKWIRDNIEYIKKNPGSFLFNINADCELIPFCYIEEERAYLEELLSLDKEYGMKEKKLNPKYKIIPFARMGSGDLYCFLFNAQSEDTRIVVYGRDTGEIEVWYENFDGFIFMQLVDSILYFEVNINSIGIQKHLEFLTDKYRNILENSTLDELKLISEKKEYKNIDIFI